jgi:hypothetical protein
MRVFAVRLDAADIEARGTVGILTAADLDLKPYFSHEEVQEALPVFSSVLSCLVYAACCLRSTICRNLPWPRISPVLEIPSRTRALAAPTCIRVCEASATYCSRHDYGTRVLRETGNLAAVMKTMGHKDVRTAMRYQHPELDIVRNALNAPQTMKVQ